MLIRKCYTAPILSRQCDGIGRHDGFKIRCLHGRVGSSPTTGTTLKTAT